MAFKNRVKSIQTASYNGARMVLKPICLHSSIKEKLLFSLGKNYPNFVHPKLIIHIRSHDSASAVEKLVRPPSPPRHEIVTTMGKVANIRHCVATGHWLSHWSQNFYEIVTFEFQLPLKFEFMRYRLWIPFLDTF